jgi:hypothetical protein
MNHPVSLCIKILTYILTEIILLEGKLRLFPYNLAKILSILSALREKPVRVLRKI